MKRRSKDTDEAIDQVQHQNIQSADEELIEASLALQFEIESDNIVLSDAAIIKSERIKGDQTQEIY